MGLRPIIFVLAGFVFSVAQARTVTSIEIIETGQSRDSSTAENCKKFQPTLSQLKNYFSKAYPVEGYMFTHERYSSCFAEGTLKFSDESDGKWELSSSGVATFIFSRGDVVTLFHRKNGWRDPFACTYGLSDKPKC
jgi:hypothetical protein